MELDHLIPEALGGLTEEDNLWLACSLCNDSKGCRIAAKLREIGARPHGVVRVDTACGVTGFGIPWIGNIRIETSLRRLSENGFFGGTEPRQ